jgi:predicted molibdopterin-dependent oxidoreductase YjgC
MEITINQIRTEIQADETLLEAALRMGFAIPSLCYAQGANHKSSCMVCAVKDCTSGQIIPSCTTRPVEGMQIETDSSEVRLVRTLSLELLLSDHRADCDAPCSMVCPRKLDVERMLTYYDSGRPDKAYRLIAATFSSEITCDGCKAPCEKACRRGTVDNPVAIRSIIRTIAENHPDESANGPHTHEPIVDKNLFQSRLGRFGAKERAYLKETTTTLSTCLHCACTGKSNCKLRTYATEANIKRPRYEASSALPAMNRIHVTGKLWFEQAKCIRCGLCVYNSENGFTFKDRGFGMQVFIPKENKCNVREELSLLCPTGALYLSET